MVSVRGSALEPRSSTGVPLTATRPWTMRPSAARRETTPAAERIFCSRSSTRRLYARGAEALRLCVLEIVLGRRVELPAVLVAVLDLGRALQLLAVLVVDA